MRRTVKKILGAHPRLLRLAQKAEPRVARIGAGARWRRLDAGGEIRLELGSGPARGKDGWTTVDLCGADINWDLRRGIPLGDGRVREIYSSHLLEHIPYRDLLALLTECRRALAPDGVFSVCVPNARPYVEAYLKGETFRGRERWYQPAAVDTGSGIDQLNYVAYMGGEHHYMFDEENLLNTLRAAGFGAAELRSFDPERDRPERDFGSIYAVARPLAA